ncbi:MAG: NAD(P)/FAD-dependent oxidoreductase [Pleurocapsa minor GSE-CHR-MK-17-07R]|jgi:phytoene dehydrogenase-like protein|nr:NAD(P)/FAD-dependent oxidoreductase [Pleurocapsa minor GSE-CHR-MK 17-07R]
MQRKPMREYDAVIVGSGPNGLAAAITLAQSGRKVLVLEAKDTVGGGMRTLELTLPGFYHDMCSSVHPLAMASPFFRSLPLQQHGLEWVFPPAELAHPYDDGTAVLIERSIAVTAARMGKDAAAYRRLMHFLVRNYESILDEFLAPLHLPRHPLVMAGFGMLALPSASWFSRRAFRTEAVRGVFAGMAAHSIMPLEQPATAAFGLILGMLAHAVGWPLARGGSAKIAGAIVSYLTALGGEIITNAEVRSLRDIPPAATTLFDVTPRQFIRIMGDALPSSYRYALERYRYGPGVYKIDYALSEPIPWTAKECLQAGTVHLGGTLDAIRNSERAAWTGQPAAPFSLVVQPTLFDTSRAPSGKHIGWVYCHVPNGSGADMTAAIEHQIERFAPGFRDCVLARHVTSATQMEAYNANYIGGDINGGVQDLRQLFTRPVMRVDPYRTPLKGVYLCSSSTPPGGGVHGMCGYHAAQSALRFLSSIS